jgi:two-component system, cell cycle response regulator DivK
MSEPPLDRRERERRLQAFSDPEFAKSVRAERDAHYGAAVETQSQAEHNTRSIQLRGEIGRALILIREDNQLNVRLFRDLLELVMECVTVSTADGYEALELAYRQAPDLIQSDIQGPNQSGLEFARLLKADARTRHIPLVCVSAWGAGPGGEAKVLEAGFDAWMAKPIGVPHYVDLIGSYLSPSGCRP